MLIYTKKSGRRHSITTVWCFILAIVFAVQGKWDLHLAAIAVGSMDVWAMSFWKLWESKK